MTEYEYNRTKAQLSVLKDLQGEYGHKTLDNVVHSLTQIVKHYESKQKQNIMEGKELMIGDWLVENQPNNYARFVQILDIVNVQGKERYRISRDIHNDEDVVECDFVENYYHLFALTDAKDGDVLVCNNYVFIFKDYNKTNDIVSSYCDVLKDGTNSKNFTEVSELCRGIDVAPATLKEHTLLFEKMREAGYRWDSEEKRLIRTPKPKEATGVLKQLLNEEAKWNEEDESFVNDLANYFTATDTLQHDEYVVIAWLKALKRRFMAHPKDNSPHGNVAELS